MSMEFTVLFKIGLTLFLVGGFGLVINVETNPPDTFKYKSYSWYPAMVGALLMVVDTIIRLWK